MLKNLNVTSPNSLASFILRNGVMDCALKPRFSVLEESFFRA